MPWLKTPKTEVPGPGEYFTDPSETPEPLNVIYDAIHDKTYPKRQIFYDFIKKGAGNSQKQLYIGSRT